MQKPNKWQVRGTRLAAGILVAAVLLFLGRFPYLYLVNQQLTLGVKDDDLEAARTALWLGADPDYRAKPTDGPRAPVLTEAARLRHTRIVRVLLEHGADPLQPDSKSTALIYAAQRSDAEAVRLLLDHGASANSMDISSRSALNYAAGNTEIATLLLSKGADANHRDAAGVTPLMVAASLPNVASVRLLLDRDAKIDLRNKKGKTALHYAATSGPHRFRDNHSTAPLILPPGDPGQRRAQLESTLTVIRLLLDRGADINARGRDGNTPLLDAISIGGQTAVVTLLLSRKANVHLENLAHRTALQSALEQNDTDLAQLLK